MKKALISLCVLAAVVLFGAAQARAADSGTIAVTVTVEQALDITVSPSDGWTVGSVVLDETRSTFASGTQGYFTVDNNGNGTSYVDIKADILGGCSIGSPAGANTFFIGHGQATGEAFVTEATPYTPITTDDTNLATIPYGDEYLFDLQLTAPSSTTYGGVPQTITITITAKAS